MQAASRERSQPAKSVSCFFCCPLKRCHLSSSHGSQVHSLLEDKRETTVNPPTHITGKESSFCAHASAFQKILLSEQMKLQSPNAAIQLSLILLLGCYSFALLLRTEAFVVNPPAAAVFSSSSGSLTMGPPRHATSRTMCPPLSQQTAREQRQSRHTQQQQPRQRLNRLFMAEDADDADKSQQQQQQDQQEEPAGTLDQPDGVAPDSHEELMYTLGVNLARQLGDVRPLVEDGKELAQVAKGLLDTVIGRLSEDGQRQLLQRRGGELNQLITDRANKIKETLEKAGREMLEEMVKAEGAVTLPSGVILHVLEHGPDGPGRGTRPTKASTVKVHYHGTLADGTVFDSTLAGEPVQLPLAGVIPGWRDGLSKMHEGETAMLGIPPEQGYGPNGTPDGSIPGGSTLFFKIQLLEVMSAGIGGEPTLLGADGKKMEKKTSSEGSGLLGADGKPLV